MVLNGFTLEMVWVTITNIGQSVFPSPFESSKIFTLKYLLHVPSITKNLLCVSKFALDNNVFFEFHSHFCFVKDQISKKLLLEGNLGMDCTSLILLNSISLSSCRLFLPVCPVVCSVYTIYSLLYSQFKY